ncbi:stage II sporulation protein D [Caproiciproducens faecalis]|uniref:Stage II sporulation protein D n=1 Tax=Caproiciproducens faecalis TaxID=2820301 RepID=A0ABS7DJV4_9FIRM|nr:stage II sporulation protein D [Caproiciproducens faecalis]MBW7571579.1 stage II sporulation protein D [Caproiciproducens faecalis]
MKGKTLLGLLLFFLMFLIPFLSLGAKIPDKTDKPSSKAASSVPPQKQNQSQEKPQSQPTSQTPQSTAPAAQGTAQFKILDAKSSQILTVDDRSFLYGAIATEMSPESSPEALKAQGVAAYTYYSRLREQERTTPTAALKGADFSADTQGWQIYVTNAQMQERWGTNFNEYYNKLTQVVNAVYGQVLKSGDDLADATYYAISSGNTETSEDIWGGKRSYLVSVASPGDVFSSGYQTTVTLSADQFKAAALKVAPKANLGADAAKWVGSIARTTAGSVKTIEIGGVSVTGNDARNAFNLRSANFTVSCKNNTFTFVVKGYGHGVGMSQVGAQYMASQGSDYKQILAWYYPTTTLTTVST